MNSQLFNGKDRASDQYKTSDEKSFQMEELEKVLENEIISQKSQNSVSINSQDALTMAQKKTNIRDQVIIEEKKNPEIESEEESIYDLELTDNYQTCAKKIKQGYTIKKKQEKKIIYNELLSVKRMDVKLKLN